MKDDKSVKELSDEILREMNAWNTSNADATFLEREVKARELVSKLEAHLIQESALERHWEHIHLDLAAYRKQSVVIRLYDLILVPNHHAGNSYWRGLQLQ